MQVQKLTLNNVRQFQENTFPFHPGFNLLVGENGAGKTTILRSLLTVLGGAKQTGRRLGLTEEDISIGANGLHVSAQVADPISGRNVVLSYRKGLWKTALRGRPMIHPLVLLYSSNEATCPSFVGRRLKRYGSSAAEDTRVSESFLYEAELREQILITPGGTIWK